jgi:hypothetical protein
MKYTTSSFLKVLLGIFILSGYTNILAQQSSIQSKAASAGPKPLFQENKGQFDPQAKFLYQSGGFNMWLTGNGVVYDLYKTEYDSSVSTNLYAEHEHRTSNRIIACTGHVIAMEFENTSSESKISSTDRQEGIFNYFIGKDSTKWVTDVHTYSGVHMQNLYDGIDALFYTDNGMPRYDLVVSPGADLQKVAIKFNGQDGITLDKSGALVIKTSLGNFEQQNLFAYQMVAGKQKQVSCHFTIDENNIVRFRAGEYDHSQQLIIDPLIYSTFLGGGVGSTIYGIAVDAYQNVYVAGGTYDRDFPVTTGAYQIMPKTQPGLHRTGFISKLNASGSALIYSTYLGGSVSSDCFKISVDAGGNAFVTGEVIMDFPVTLGAFQNSYSRPVQQDVENGFAVKLNSAGNKLLYSTYIAPISDVDVQIEVYSSVIDSSGNLYTTGWVESPGDSVIDPSIYFPKTPGAFHKKNDLNCNTYSYILKLNSTGTKLIYSTCIPGVFVYGLALDSSANVYLAGTAACDSNSFPATTGSYMPGGQGASACVTKLNRDGTALVYSTYIDGNTQAHGWTDFSYGRGIAVDRQGNAYVCGYACNTDTTSSDYPVTPGVFQTRFNGRILWGGYYSNAFVTKLNTSGSNLIYSTFIGGARLNGANGIAVDSLGNACIFGQTDSRGQYPIGYPVTPDAFQKDNNDGTGVQNHSAFLTKLNSCGTDLIYSTYLGGSYTEIPYGLAIDLEQNIYLAGTTGSTTGKYPRAFPTTPGAFEDTVILTGQGYQAGFITKFDSIPFYSSGSSIPDPHFWSARIINDSLNITIHLPIYFHRSTTVSDVDMIMHYPSPGSLKYLNGVTYNGKSIDVAGSQWAGRAALHFAAADLNTAPDSLIGYANFLWTPYEYACDEIVFDSIDTHNSEAPCSGPVEAQPFNGFVGSYKTCGIAGVVDNAVLQPFDFSIYPNPARNKIEISLTNSTGEFLYELFDALGVARKIGVVFDSSVQIDISDLSSGNYYLRMKGVNSFPVTKKVIIIK